MAETQLTSIICKQMIEEQRRKENKDWELKGMNTPKYSLFNNLVNFTLIFAHTQTRRIHKQYCLASSLMHTFQV